MRDFQKAKVYRWEDIFVAPTIRKKQSIEVLVMLANHMWTTLGFENPPKVFLNEAYKVKSTGSRYNVALSRHQLDEFTLCHELAHSMNHKEDRNVADGHGPNYVADYCSLLIKFYGFDFNFLIGTLSKHGVKINLALLIQHIEGHPK